MSERIEEDLITNYSGRMMRLAHRWAKRDISPIIGDLPQGEFFLMMGLYHMCKEVNSEEITVTYLANVFEVSLAAISRMVTNMEKKGYIEKIRQQNNKRSTYIRLTELGTSVIEDSEKKGRIFLRAVIKRMGFENFGVMVNYMEQLHDAIDDEINACSMNT